MSISKRVQRYLTSMDIPFEVIHHQKSEDTLQTAAFAKIPPMSIARAVILEDQEGQHLMAIVPGSDRVRLTRLSKLAGRELSLVTEANLAKLFNDCDTGAIPALGPAFQVETWFDHCLLKQDRLYIESGDHQCLLELSRADFERAMEQCNQGEFSELDGGEIQL